LEFFKAENTRLIHINGDAGSGKSTFIKAASFYAFERGLFEDGVINISMKGRSEVNYIYYNLAKYMEVPEYRSNEITDIIDDKNILFIFDSLDSMIRRSDLRLRNLITTLIEQTRAPKFVLLSNMHFEMPGEG
jgi:hypothetical protein